MASSKRRPDKQKRLNQNRQLRGARSARSAHAGEATAVAQGTRPPAGQAAAAPAAKGARPRRQRSWFGANMTIPGQRAVTMSFLFALVSAFTLLVTPIRVPRDVAPDDPRVEDSTPELNDDGTVTVLEEAKLLDEEGVPASLLIMVGPVAITGAALAFTKRPQRSTAWTLSMVVLSGFVFFASQGYGIVTLPSLAALALGGFQSRRLESRERLAQIRADRAARAAAKASGVAGAGDVIDVDAVEADPSGGSEAAGETAVIDLTAEDDRSS